MVGIGGYVFDPYGTLFEAGDRLFVSSNAWDVARAKTFGYRVAWCNRVGAPEEELGVRAAIVIRRLDELPR